jgi:hypothetical protein
MAAAAALLGSHHDMSYVKEYVLQAGDAAAAQLKQQNVGTAHRLISNRVGTQR